MTGTPLNAFKTLQSDDGVKRDLELTCTVCGEHLCDVEHDDELGVLVLVAQGHECPGAWTDEAARELLRLETAFEAAGDDGRLAAKIDMLCARRDWDRRERNGS